VISGSAGRSASCVEGQHNEDGKEEDSPENKNVPYRFVAHIHLLKENLTTS
jgi:hypothetical protein